MNSDSTTVEARLRKLERQNRILLVTLITGGILIACTAARVPTVRLPSAGKAVTNEIRAQRFVLVDGKDQEIGVWETSSEGLPWLVMGTNTASRAVMIGQNKDGAFAALLSPSANRTDLYVTNSASTMVLTGRDSAGNMGYISLLGGTSSTVNIANGNGAGQTFNPGGSFPVYSYRPGGKVMDWFIATDGMALNGLPLKLNDYDGKLIKQLP